MSTNYLNRSNSSGLATTTADPQANSLSSCLGSLLERQQGLERYLFVKNGGIQNLGKIDYNYTGESNYLRKVYSTQCSKPDLWIEPSLVGRRLEHTYGSVRNLQLALATDSGSDDAELMQHVSVSPFSFFRGHRTNFIENLGLPDEELTNFFTDLTNDFYAKTFDSSNNNSNANLSIDESDFTSIVANNIINDLSVDIGANLVAMQRDKDDEGDAILRSYIYNNEAVYGCDFTFTAFLPSSLSINQSYPLLSTYSRQEGKQRIELEYKHTSAEGGYIELKSGKMLADGDFDSSETSSIRVNIKVSNSLLNRDGRTLSEFHPIVINSKITTNEAGQRCYLTVNTGLGYFHNDATFSQDTKVTTGLIIGAKENADRDEIEGFMGGYLGEFYDKSGIVQKPLNPYAQGLDVYGYFREADKEAVRSGLDEFYFISEDEGKNIDVLSTHVVTQDGEVGTSPTTRTLTSGNSVKIKSIPEIPDNTTGFSTEDVGRAVRWLGNDTDGQAYHNLNNGEVAVIDFVNSGGNELTSSTSNVETGSTLYTFDFTDMGVSWEFVSGQTKALLEGGGYINIVEQDSKWDFEEWGAEELYGLAGESTTAGYAKLKNSNGNIGFFSKYRSDYEVGDEILIIQNFGSASKGEIVVVDQLAENIDLGVTHPGFRKADGTLFFSQPAVSGFGQGIWWEYENIVFVESVRESPTEGGMTESLWYAGAKFEIPIASQIRYSDSCPNGCFVVCDPCFDDIRCVAVGTKPFSRSGRTFFTNAAGKKLYVQGIAKRTGSMPNNDARACLTQTPTFSLTTTLCDENGNAAKASDVTETFTMPNGNIVSDYIQIKNIVLACIQLTDENGIPTNRVAHFFNEYYQPDADEDKSPSIRLNQYQFTDSAGSIRWDNIGGKISENGEITEGLISQADIDWYKENSAFYAEVNFGACIGASPNPTCCSRPTTTTVEPCNTEVRKYCLPNGGEQILLTISISLPVDEAMRLADTRRHAQIQSSGILTVRVNSNDGCGVFGEEVEGFSGPDYSFTNMTSSVPTLSCYETGILDHDGLSCGEIPEVVTFTSTHTISCGGAVWEAYVMHNARTQAGNRVGKKHIVCEGRLCETGSIDGDWCDGDCEQTTTTTTPVYEP